MDDAVLVIGGYGTVGRSVCTLLAKRGVSPVIAAGRSRDKAQQFAARIDGVCGAVIDIYDASTYDAVLDDASVVVMALDADTPALARACFERGIDYVDVSPTDRLLRRIERLDDLARTHNATGLLSVGLSPGLTNLFVDDAIQHLDRAMRADITLLLGLGEAFGPDTIKWMVEDAIGPFSVYEGGRRRHVDAFTEPRLVDLPSWGRRRAYRMNLADQHVLARTTALPTIGTRLCYDSRVVTAGLALAHRAGILVPLAARLGADTLAQIVTALPLFADASVIHAEVEGYTAAGRTVVTHWLRGSDQARATACVAATAIQQLRQRHPPPGVWHLHERFSLTPFIEPLCARGYTHGHTTAAPDA